MVEDGNVSASGGVRDFVEYSGMDSQGLYPFIIGRAADEWSAQGVCTLPGFNTRCGGNGLLVFCFARRGGLAVFGAMVCGDVPRDGRYATSIVAALGRRCTLCA